MGNLGWPEILIILVIALIIFGPRKLPELGKTLGQSLAQFRKASEDFKRTWEEEVEVEKRRIEAPPAVHEASDSSAHEVAAASPPVANEEPNYWANDLNTHAPTTPETVTAAPLAPTLTPESQAVPRQAKRDWM
ncbi:MAG: twin-arginine translocase TatA/TatE family subunit [Acidobacteria bacterium]|nr:twin-arginine translocase TatA/TatE family subunit [Acidobacteriota bacterium]